MVDMSDYFPFWAKSLAKTRRGRAVFGGVIQL